jgi:leucyl/phenylalanyl-tRNA--protein transferase
VSIEPPATPWNFPPAHRWDPEDDLVALGADLEPGTLLAAYRRGLFPMPTSFEGEPMGWFSPVRRGILPLGGLKVSRSLRRSVRDFEIRVDTSFAEVMRHCGRSDRPDGWINEEVVAAYVRLHELGWAHSVETWQDGRLVGGLYGVSIGGLFAGESMFHTVRDASKVALVALVEMLSADAPESRMLDVQWRTEHLGSLGVVEVRRDDYLAALQIVLGTPLPEAFAR